MFENGHGFIHDFRIFSNFIKCHFVPSIIHYSLDVAWVPLKKYLLYVDAQLRNNYFAIMRA